MPRSKVRKPEYGNNKKPISKDKKKGSFKPSFKGNNGKDLVQESEEDYDNTKPNRKGRGNPNDLSWYCTDPQVLQDVARIPYNIPVGYPFTRDGHVETGLFGRAFDDAIPGIASMTVIPALGRSDSPKDTVNVAAASIWTYIRSRISGARTYDPNDIMLYVMGVDAIYYWIALATRIYATTSLFHQGNRYLPEALLAAQHVDPADIRLNLNWFRSQLNQRILKISTLVMPANMPIFKRHSWLFSNYFVEGPSVKDQIYVYTPGAYYKFALDASGAGMLKAAVPTGSNSYMGINGLMSASDIIAILDEMIDAIFGNEDFITISGDFLKAYEGNIMKLALVPDLLPIGVEFNEGVLLQFKNAKCKYALSAPDSSVYTGRRFRFNNFDITQDATKSFLQVAIDPHGFDEINAPTGSITYSDISSGTAPLWQKQIMQAMWNEYSKPIMLTSPSPVVEPGENMINTRLIPSVQAEYDAAADDLTTVWDITFGSEWPAAVTYMCFHRDKVTGIVTLINRRMQRVMYCDQGTTDPLDYLESYLPIRSAFKYAPELSIVARDLSDQVFTSGRQYFEVDNYALTDHHAILGLHNAALQGEYNIPKLAVATS